MTHSHSETNIPGPMRSWSTRPRRSRHFAVAIVAVAALAGPALGIIGALVTTDRYIVSEDAVISEDQYVTAMSAIVEGTIDGDLTIFSGNVTISGTITGSVTTFSSGTVAVAETGSIGGSLNGAAANLSLSGSVGSDVFFTAASIVIEETATVERDAITFGGTSRVEGTIARDVRGRTIRMSIDGDVGGDVDIATQFLSVGPTAVIAGDVLYRSPGDADFAAGATVDGTITKLPTQGNFVYGLILSIATVVTFLGFLVGGIVALWVLRGTGSRAVGAVLTRPISALFAGLATVIALPSLIVLAAVTLVGVPIAAILLALAVILFVVGPVPAVTALGNRILVRRGGLFGAFLVGAVLWRIGIWLIPYVGVAIYVLGMVWGIGGWVLGALAARRSDPIPAALLPASIAARGDATPEWEPPLAPGTRSAVAERDQPDDPYPAWGAEQAATAAAVASATSPTPEADPLPVDPNVERDTSLVDVPVAFGDAQDEPEDDTGIEQGADDDGPDPSVLTDGAGDTDEVVRPTSASERFAALRDGLASTGTVQPVTDSAPDHHDAPDPDEGEEPTHGDGGTRDDGDGDGWGLPRR